MNTIYKIVGAFVLLMSTLIVNAQNFQEDLASAYEQFSCTEQVLLDVDLWKTSDGEVVESVHSVLKKNGDNYLYHIGKQNMLYTPKAYLIIDNEEEVLYYSPNYKSGEQPIDITGLEKIDLIIESSEKIEYIGVANNNKVYEISNSKEIVSKLKIYFDTKTGLINKVIQYYNPEYFEMEMEQHMRFNKIELAPNFKSEDFSETAYVSFEKKEDKINVKPIGKFSSYEISVQNF